MSMQGVNKVLRNEIARLQAMEDKPTQRGHQSQKLIETLQHFLLEASEERRAAWRDLHTIYGWSFGMIAEEYGVSRARTQQIVG